MSSLFGGSSGTSAFGQKTNQQQKPLFGAINTSQPQQSASLFGGSTNPSQAQSSGGLFGTASNTGSLFESKPNQPAQQASNIFGGPLNQSQPTTSKPTLSLFGATNNQPTQQSSGLFGSSNTTSQPQQPGNLFGAPVTTSQPSGSLFGSTLNVPTQPSAPSLFLTTPLGSTSAMQQQQQQQQQQAQKPSLFGSTINSQSQFAGSLRMGQSVANPQQNQQTTVPGVKIDTTNIRGTTRFNDLHEELQKQIEQIDNFIAQQVAFKEQCDALMPPHAESVATLAPDVAFLTSKVETVELALDNDGTDINHMKGVVQRDAADAQISFRVVDNLQLPHQFHYYAGALQAAPQSSSRPTAEDLDTEGKQRDLVSYFASATAEMNETLALYQKNIDEIEAHLSTVEASTIAQTQQLMFTRGRDGVARSKEEQVRELAAVLREFEGGILNVAGKVGGVREEVQQLVLKDSGFARGRGGAW